MKKYALSFIVSFLLTLGVVAQNKIVVLQTDFGLKDGAVSEMKGVAMGVSPELKLFDLTHEIPAYNIWEASYRLYQTINYWPKGTVFVSVVDPGVGTSRKSVVLKTNTGQYIVTPDNGTLTHVAETYGIAEIRQIDEAVNRRKGSGKSYTFHGRDVYVYTAARLAAGIISYEQVGPALPRQVVIIPYQKAVFENGMLKGTIDVLDVQYGNIWTDISDELVKKLSPKYGDLLHLKIFNKSKMVYEGEAPYSETFGSVPQGKPLSYLNSLLQLSFALNMGSFADTYKIGSGSNWSVEVTRK
ncbi:S-adenosyl-l-methionine hydroxide adenosyltransferase family protein [Inquilinus sp. KBS0705]|nr:S-adenosyl-l-methionine hydroxide adenosyltransferase family protein [Inquilinus sp. KBS0705]